MCDSIFRLICVGKRWTISGFQIFWYYCQFFWTQITGNSFFGSVLPPDFPCLGFIVCRWGIFSGFLLKFPAVACAAGTG